MTSVAPLLFDDVVGNIHRLFRFAVIGEVDLLVFSHQTDVAPQFPVTKGSHRKQGNGAKQQATPEPRNAVVPFVFGDGPAKDGARYPEEKQRDQEAHHQSVVATHR